MMNKANEDYPRYFNILQEKETPIFAVMWNHDVMWDKETVKIIPENSSITLLKNESTGIDWIQIVWLTDKSIRWETKLEDHLEECNIKSNNEFTILITHQPISLEKLKDYPIDLEVAGHTHHGQIFWLRKLTEIVNDYWYWKYEENWKTAIVTQWIWTRGLPFRLGTQSEIVIIKLKKK
jgi:predicted MPP superfamily phosphohydrolase